MSTYSKAHPVLKAQRADLEADVGRQRDAGDALDDQRAFRQPGPRAPSKTTSTYAIPDIDDPRTRDSPAIPAGAPVKGRVTQSAISVAGYPIQSATRIPIWGVRQVGDGVPPEEHRASPPPSARAAPPGARPPSALVR